MLTVATGMEEHNDYGRGSSKPHGDQQTMPALASSGGVSNVSFSFRGNEPVRDAMHTVFLYHGIQAGMDYGHRQCRSAGDLRETSRRICANTSKT